MASRISVLPEYISNRIAAGEIIERPASIVRELLDNSIDAGADRIEIDIEQGGAKLIRVVDNGSGFDPDGLLLAFERHATSKIKTLDDLDAIHTLGFRGEALPSIASISMVKVESFSSDSEFGGRLHIHGGKIESMEHIACSPGTSITIRNIFYNTPARRKFLKTSKTEYAHIYETVVDHALTHPSVFFILRDSGKVSMETPTVDLWSARVTAVFGKKFVQQHMPVTGSHPDIHIQGMICHPEHLRSTGRSQRLYVNGRRVRDRIITQAIYKGYAQYITGSGHPSCILRITLPPEMVDINVHPAKSEVRFRDANSVFNLISSLINHTLSGSMKMQFDLSRPVKYATPPQTRIDHGTRSHLAGVFSQPSDADSHTCHETVSSGFPVKTPVDAHQPVLIPGDSWHVIGQVFNTFILLEFENRMLIIDQHTAHERILFERFKSQYQSGNIASQSLLFPVPVELEPPQYDIILAYRDLLGTMGLVIEPFGKNTLAVNAMPEHLAQEAPDILLHNLSDELFELGDTERSRVAERRMLVSLACRKAVKAGDRMGHSQMEAIVKDIMQYEIPNSCPHGRPIIVALDASEIAGKFKR
jgi:DNA mismatch repair protein MutL